MHKLGFFLSPLHPSIYLPFSFFLQSLIYGMLRLPLPPPLRAAAVVIVVVTVIVTVVVVVG